VVEVLAEFLVKGLSFTWPFYWPLFLAVAIRVAFGVTVLWTIPVDGATGHAMMFAAAVTLVGGLVTVCAVVPGLVAFAATYLVAQGIPAESLVMALLSAGGLTRVGVLIVTTTLVLWALSAGAGAILWFVFGQRTAHVSVVRWVLRNSALWTLGFVGSLIAGLAIAVALPGVSADVILEIGGFATGLAAGKWVRDVAEEFEPDRETEGVIEPLGIPAPAGELSPNEWHRQTRTGA
jgi:hypothetical protein